MRIDSHQHFWRYDPVKDGWITGEMDVLKRDFLPEELISELQSNGMDGCVAIQASQSEQETLFLLGLAEHHAFICGVVGWVNLLAPDVPHKLECVSRYKRLRGFRHILQSEPDDRFMLRPEFQRGIEYLGQSGFTYDILIYPKQLPAAIELVTRFPEQRFAIDHLAKPAIRAKQIDDWKRQIREVAGNPNVYCKLSGLVTEADWKHWKYEDFTPYLDVAFDAFGADRLMFGSDWPVCLLAASYSRVKGLLDHYTCDFSREEKDKIFGRNAARFYGLAAER
jgi:L-fuconolactonase